MNHTTAVRHRHTLFVDIKKAFDHTASDILPQLLAAYGFGPKLSTIIQLALLDDISVRLPDGSYSSCFSSTTGVKQGCPLSPQIFRLYVDLVLRNVQPILSRHIGGLTNLAYADDITLLCPDPQSAQHALNLLEAELNKVGLRISASKTKAMIFTNPITTLHIGDSSSGLDR